MHTLKASLSGLITDTGDPRLSSPEQANPWTSRCRCRRCQHRACPSVDVLMSSLNKSCCPQGTFTLCKTAINLGEQSSLITFLHELLQFVTL